MCLSAIYWSRIGTIYYGNTYTDAAEIGFSDEHIYKELKLRRSERAVKSIQMCHMKLRKFSDIGN